MNKKIRYAIGAVGAMPALAMIPAQLAAPAAHARKTAATTGKKVRTVYARDTAAFATTSSVSPNISPNVGSCRGITGHHNTHSDITVRFYTRAEPSNRTCIGTIKVSDSGPQVFQLSGLVHNSGGNFCTFQGGIQQTVVSHRCRRIFRNDNGFDARSPLTVEGISSPFFGATGHVKSTIPFRNDGF